MNQFSSTPARDAFITLHEFLETELRPSAAGTCLGSPAFAKFAAEIQKEVERADRRARLEQTSADTLNEAELGWKRAFQSIEELRDEVSRAIQSFAHPELAQAFYRKLEDAGETDLQSLLSDWEELERDEIEGDNSGRL
jgi:hypothetical protein